MTTDSALWPTIADERLGLADLFDRLTELRRSEGGLCEGWTVRDVAAHLVTPLGQRHYRFTPPGLGPIAILTDVAKRGHLVHLSWRCTDLDWS